MQVFQCGSRTTYTDSAFGAVMRSWTRCPHEADSWIPYDLGAFTAIEGDGLRQGGRAVGLPMPGMHLRPTLNLA